METAVIYARVSTIKQKKFGVSQDAQVVRCRQYAEMLGYDVVYTGIEAESAKDMNRVELQTIIQMVNKKQINHICVAKLDRLSRETDDAIKLGKLFSKKGVTLHLVTEGGPVDLNDPSQELLFTVRAGMGKFERRRISLNTKFGMARKRDLGQRISRRAPYGHEFDGNKVIVCADEQSVIIKIKGLHAKGYSERKIIAQLTKDGIFNREGHEFSRSTIRTVLAMAA